MLDIRHTAQERWLDGPHGFMRYWESSHGPTTGVPILFLHGYSSLIEHWKRVAGPIARHHPCYALDLYGLGYSATLPVVPDKQLWVDQVARFIEQVIRGPAVLIGNSLGGMVSAQLAADHPDLVRGVVLVDSIGLPGAPALYPLPERAFYKIIHVPLVGEAMALLLGRPLGVLQFLLALYHRRDRIAPDMVNAISGPISSPRAALFRLEILRSIERFALSIQPGDVVAPMLILWGEKDPILPPMVARSFQATMFPHADLHLIPHSGHCPFDETPDEFCDIVLAWIEKRAIQRAAS